VAVGLVGAVLGAAVGFIPGIAVTYPLTRNFTGEPGPSHYLSIPWLLIGALVVALPVLTAAVVGLVARSRLPVVARLD
jgi:putative ABC transport system permease protein